MSNEQNDLVTPPPDGFACLLKTHVAGVKYYEFADGDIPLDPGGEVVLRREPDNPHDRRAIEVYTLDGQKLGYLPRRDNESPSRLMDAGIELPARLESVESPRRYADPPRRVRPRLQVAVFIERPAGE